MARGYVKLVIPWEHCVSKNQKTTVWGKGRPALTAKYRNAKESISVLTKKQARRKPYDTPVRIEFVLYEPDRRRRDILNYTQIICDGIEGVAYNNDAQIQYVVVKRGGLDKSNPRMEVRITKHASK